MITKRISCSLLACAASLSADIQANTAEEAVHGLARECYAIQSPENGNFLKKFHNGGSY